MTTPCGLTRQELAAIGVVQNGICRTPFTRDGIRVVCDTPAADHPSSAQGKDQFVLLILTPSCML